MTSSLQDKRIVVTRAPHQAPELSALLEERGAVPVEVPVIEITDPGDGGLALNDALRRVAAYDWIVLTSINAAHRVAPFLLAFAGKVAAIGVGTAERLEDAGVAVHLVPPEFVAESLVDAFPAGGGRVLVPRAEVARPVLIDGLRDKGWDVDVVTAYKTVPAPVTEEARHQIATAAVVTFTSSSTVINFVAAYGDVVPTVVACIGPITEQTARSAGLPVHISSPEHTISGLVQAMEEYFAVTQPG